MVQFWLCENIPFTNTYEDVVSFPSEDLQQSFFKGKSVYTELSNNFRIIDDKISFRINKGYEECLSMNYLVILQNEKHYYYFVDSVAYSDVDTTLVNGTIDVWQTFMFEHEILDSFIKREHQDRFKIKGDVLEPIFNTEKENIELGEEMETTSVQTFSNYNYDLTGSIYNEQIYFVYIVMSELDVPYTDESFYYYSRGGINSGYVLLCVPLLKNDNINTVIGLEHTQTNGDVFEKDFYSAKELMNYLKKPQIVSAYVSGYSPFRFKTKRDGSKVIMMTNFINESGGVGLYTNDTKGISIIVRGDNYIYTNLQIPTGLKEDYVKSDININTNKLINYEPKLSVKPYKITSFTNRIVEPLQLGDNDYNKHIFFIENFGINYDCIIGTDKFDNTRYFDYVKSTKNIELPTMNDRYLNYVSSNKASATTGIALSGVQALVGGAVAVASGGVGVPMFLGLSLATSGTKQVMNELMKQSDLRQSPITVKSDGNNLGLQTAIRNDFLLKGIVRKIRKEFKIKAFEYFYRFGYKANKFGVPNLKSRWYFNYIELAKVSIGGNLSQNNKEKLENIYKNGCTIWHYRNSSFEMYKYDKENMEVSLI